jgi:UDP-N-acetylmuramate dehydrogenase
MILIEENYPLKSLNTFGINAHARFFAEATTPEDMKTVISIFKDNEQPKLIMGGGSNLLFTSDFNGVIYYPSIKGIEITRMNDTHVWVKTCAGENWDQFVAYCVKRNWGGIENLSLIPGNVGACPIQNIGAYGVEVKDCIDSVEALDLNTCEIQTFSNAECRFGYRDSIFKNELANRYLISAVTFRLTLNPQANTAYKDVLEELKHFDKLTIASVREAIINIRRRKLPDPEEFGNAGSFFKNPVIPIALFEKIRSDYPEVPLFPVSENLFKIPAAWLIQTAGWKARREGNTGTHPSQPLVIINYGGATGSEIVAFAKKVQEAVFKIFSVELEMEVRII